MSQNHIFKTYNMIKIIGLIEVRSDHLIGPTLVRFPYFPFFPTFVFREIEGTGHMFKCKYFFHSNAIYIYIYDFIKKVMIA